MEENGRGNDSGHRHAVWGAETRGGSWRVAGVGYVQVYEGLLRERRWGVGVTDRCGDYKRILVGGRYDVGGTDKYLETAETCGTGGDSISVNHYQWSLYT